MLNSSTQHPWGHQGLLSTACLPALQGLGLLALGAGVGEEVLFRGFVQAAADSGLAGALPALPPAAATAAALAGTSVAFGALHALTPLYFAFATAAGALFGEGAPRSEARAAGDRGVCCPAGAALPPLTAPLQLRCRHRVRAVWPTDGGGDALGLRLARTRLHPAGVGRRQRGGRGGVSDQSWTCVHYALPSSFH